MDIFRPNKEEILRYGEYLVDELFVESNRGVDSDFRIRVIKYIGSLYYHKMKDGEIVDFRRLE